MLMDSATPRTLAGVAGHFLLGPCQGLRLIAKRIKHDATVCNEGTDWDTNFLPNEVAKSLGMNLERDHLQLGFTALRHVLREDLSVERGGANLAGFFVLALRLAVDVLQ